MVRASVRPVLRLIKSKSQVLCGYMKLVANHCELLRQCNEHYDRNLVDTKFYDNIFNKNWDLTVDYRRCIFSRQVL